MLMITEEGRALIRQALGASLYQRNVPVTLAGPKPVAVKDKGQKLTTARHDRMLQSAIVIMRQSTASAFEFEGAVRAGIRSQLCLEGWRWSHADAVAAGITDRALSRIGAVRPTFMQGQPTSDWGDLVERTRCVNCGERIPQERKQHGPRVRFCSDACGKSESGNRTWAEWLAAAASRKEAYRTLKTKECEQCGSDFVAIDGAQRFCTLTCKGAASRIRDERPCGTCGTSFLPKMNPAGLQRFCSKPCAVTATWEKRRQTMACDDLGRVQMVPREERSCVVCSTMFRPKRASDRKSTCSVACQYRLRSQTRWGVPV